MWESYNELKEGNITALPIMISIICPNCSEKIFNKKTTGVLQSGNLSLDTNIDDSLNWESRDPAQGYIECPHCGNKIYIRE